MNSTTISHLTSQLANAFSAEPSTAWIQSFLSTQKPTTPLPSLLATAKVRFLNADITAAFSKSAVLPSNIHDAKLKERRLRGPVAVQVMDVEDMKQSCWSQIEAIEAAERGEGMKGREVVRVVPGERGDDDESLGITGASAGMCKLLLMDANGVKVWGMEFKSVQGVRVGMSIGTKFILRNVLVARAVLLLEPETASVLGGKVEGLHKAWSEGRKADLKAAIESGNSN